MKPIDAKLKIKTESIITKNLGIKQEIRTENTEHEQRSDFNRQQVRVNKDSVEEKQKLVEAFVAVKSENQKITFDLNKKSEECIKLVSEKLQLEQKTVEASAKITQLESDLSHLKHEYAEQIKECKQKFSDSCNQNQKLVARIQQLQTAMAQNIQVEKKSSDIYEVERIIGDKKTGKVQYYKIRWKGFDETHDTWERETNLMCPSMLKKYLQTKQTN